MTDVIKCNSCNIVIDELLAYVQNKVSIIDAITLVRICKSAFTSDEIKKSKSLLFDSISTDARKITRKSKGKEERDLVDIINVFRSTEPDVVPIFVARQLERLPPILFNSLDCTKLLKDMLKMQNDLDEIKTSYVTLQQLDRLKEELQVAKNNYLPPSSICNVNTKRGAWAVDTFDSGPMGILQCNSTVIENCEVAKQVPGHESANRSILQEGVPRSLHDSSAYQRSSVDKVESAHALIADTAQTHATATPMPPGERQLIQDVNIAIGTADNVSSIISVPNNDEGWNLVQRRSTRTSKYRLQGKYGVATGLQCNFKAAERKVPLLITNVHKDTTREDVMQYIRKQTNDTVFLREIHTKNRRDYKAFKMFVSENKLHMYLDEKIWPENIIFRRFVNDKYKYPNRVNSDVAGMDKENNK
ncbi:uncharacterized protein LOC133526278 [Cydia pomonella]|nr:uncharacterized protein LOC133526278 [Cydia pomonella]